MINVIHQNLFNLYIITALTLIASIIFFIFLIYKYFKQKSIKVWSIIVFIVLLCISSQMFPIRYTINSYRENNFDKSMSDINKALRFSIFPIYKGYLHSIKGYYIVFYHKEDKEKLYEAMQEFDMSYKYLNTYKTPFVDAAILSYLPFDISKVSFIAREIGDIKTLAMCNILEKDYSTAIKNITISIAKNNKAEDYIIRAVLYKKMGQTDKSDKDYNYAIKTCSSEKRCIDKLQKIYNIYSNYVKNLSNDILNTDNISI